MLTDEMYLAHLAETYYAHSRNLSDAGAKNLLDAAEYIAGKERGIGPSEVLTAIQECEIRKARA